MTRSSPRWHMGWLLTTMLAFLLLASHQLGLPGLHYDEAREAGVNAMELLTGAPVSAFRGATVTLFGRQLPLMVQDYIGALNVYLALPFLAATGIGVPNLRLLSLLWGLLALFALERCVSEWIALIRQQKGPAPISLAALVSVTLLATSPSYVFWSRQGIFVTNATLPCTFAAIWLGLGWLRTGSSRRLIGAAFAAGLALYAKLLAIWIIGPFILLAGSWWLLRLRKQGGSAPATATPHPHVTLPLLLSAGTAFMLPLLPLLIFNLQTGGTFASVNNNLAQSYYGVANSAIFANLPIRLGQVVSVLRGDHFWYLGGLQTNPFAPWLAIAAILPVLFSPTGRMYVLPPALLLVLALGSSLFTVSDLFITHYALLQPLLVAVIGLGLFWLYEEAQRLKGPVMLVPMALLTLWLGGDLSASLAYHQELTQSGGLADHSDATYHLAYHLRYNGLGAPVALDWGFDAPIRFLSEGSVTPIELFGYDSPTEPDIDFAVRLAPFLDNADNVYLLHAPGQELFAGRREIFFAQAHLHGREATLETTFAQQNGLVLIELWRLR